MSQKYEGKFMACECLRHLTTLCDAVESIKRRPMYILVIVLIHQAVFIYFV